MAYYFEIIDQEQDLIEAKRFLKTIYIDQLKWKFDIDNPSGLAVYKNAEGDFLEDRFSDKSTWFRMLDENAAIVAVARAIDRRSVNLEIENYRKIPEIFTKENLYVVEINRFAIIKTEVSAQITLQLMFHVLGHLIQENVNYILLTAQIPQPANLFKDLGMQPTDALPFKYHESDPNTVEILHLNLQDTNQNNLILQKLNIF